MSVLVLVVDDEPDVEALFRQQFRRDLRARNGARSTSVVKQIVLRSRNRTTPSISGKLIS